MAGYETIAAASETVVSVLRDRAKSDEAVPISPEEIVLAPPDDVDADSAVRLSVFPYKITRNDQQGSQNRIRVGSDTFRKPPLFVTVSYLVTAYPGSGSKTDEQLHDQQVALGLAMQVIHDTGIIDADNLKGALQGTDSFHLSLAEQANDRIEQIWGSFVDAPFSPSVVYVTSPIPIESTRKQEVTRVAERDIEMDQGTDRE